MDKIKKFDSFLNEDVNLQGLPKDLASQLYISGKGDIYAEILRSLNLEGSNSIILNKIRRTLESAMGGEPVVSPLTEDLSKEEMEKLIKFINDAKEVEKMYKDELGELIENLLK